MNIGWVKLHRKALESTAWGHPIRWSVFSYLLMTCNREPVLNKRYGYMVNAGECDHSIRRIADSVGADKDAVHRALVHLQSVGTVRRERRCKLRHAPDVLTLVNWALYNGNGDKCDTEGDTKANTECDTEGDILENKREAKKEESISSNQKRAVGYTDDYEAFWSHWPDKSSGKSGGFKHWKKLNPEQRLKALESVQKLAALWANEPKPLEYFPNIGTWFGEGRWDADEQRGPSRKTTGPKPLGGNPIGGAASW